MKRLILLLLCASLCHATSVTIAESAYTDASGRLATGTITISWPAFSNGVSNIAAGSTTVSVTSGVMSVSLVANDTADPPMVYTASFRLQTASYSQQWKVPTVAGPLTIQGVTWSSNSPVTVGLDQIRRSGNVAGDIAYYDGNLWKRLARGTNGQVLSIDTSLSGYLKWAAASGGGTWGSITGTLSDQTDLAAALAAKLAKSSNLSDLTSASTARTNLGLGTAAVAATSDFEVPLTFTSPIVRTVNAIAMAAASASVSGYLSTTDWSTFNGKQAALGFTPPPNTLTITPTSPLTGGGSLAANRTIACATCVTSAAALTADAVMAGAGLQAAVATNCTKATGQPLTCPDGFNSGGGTGPWFTDITGDTSGSIRLKATAASVTQWIATFPAATGIVMYTDTGVTAGQLPAFTGDVTKSSGSAATTVTKLNGVSLAGLATGPVCNTTTTGTPYACAASDLPTHASRHQNGGNDEVATATPGANVIPKAGSDGKLAVGFLPLLGPGVIPGSTFTSIAVANGGSGDVDLYLVPSNSRAAVSNLSCYNTAGTTTTIIPEIKVSGTYYRVAANVSATTLATGNVAYSIYFEAGESIAANFSQAGLNCHGSVIIYPNTVPFRTVKALSISTGDNTIYTVPSGFNAIAVTGSNSSYSAAGNYIGSAGGTIKWYVVPSGQVVGSTYQLTPATAVGGNNLSTLGAFKAAPSGSFVVMNIVSASGTNVAWVNVYEMPN